MKTTLLLLGLVLTTTVGFAQSVIRVQNGTDIGALIRLSTTAVGSILLLDPGTYATFTVDKRVSIIGSGYGGNNVSTIIGRVTFSTGSSTNSAGSLIMGCNVGDGNVLADNITVQRCRMNTTNDGVNIGFNSTPNNCKVTQCFVVGYINVYSNSTNFVIQNNIVQRFINLSNSTGITSGKIINNTVGTVTGNNCEPLQSSATINAVEISNNIFLSPASCDNGTINHYATTQYAKFNNNIVRQGTYQSTVVSNRFLTDMTTLFANLGTYDSNYILSANSPAKGAGENGTDCGAFGGADPYVLTGSPIGPIIQDLQVPATARQNETIQIRLRAKIQN